MSYKESENVKSGRPPASPRSAGEVYVSAGQYEVSASLAADDLIGLSILPAGCMPVDFTLVADDLETSGSPTITLTVGILNSDEDGLVASSEFMTAETVAQAGGVARADVKTFLDNIDVDEDDDRVIAVKVVAAATTPAIGTVYGNLLYRASEYGL